MVRLLSYISLSISIASMLGCNRGGVDSSHSTITIRSPAHLNSMSLPTGQIVCYGINISGGNLRAPANTCGPASALNAGFIPSGQDITANVPRDQIIQVDLYAYLEPSGVNVPCPTWNVAMSGSNLSNVYLLGSALNVSTTNASTDVTITENYTGTNIVSQMNLPTSCTGNGTTAPTPFALGAGGGIATGTAVQMNARVGRPAVMTSAAVKLTVQ